VSVAEPAHGHRGHAGGSLVMLLVEASDTLPLATVGITFRAGCADEPAELTGLARVTSRMVRRKLGADSEASTRAEIERRLDRLGAELSEHVGIGATTFSCEVLAGSLVPAADLLAELLAEPCA